MQVAVQVVGAVKGILVVGVTGVDFSWELFRFFEFSNRAYSSAASCEYVEAT